MKDSKFPYGIIEYKYKVRYTSWSSTNVKRKLKINRILNRRDWVITTAKQK